ncbi:MAG TPA: lysoplasmalogenase [Symbiobacteriaceae bacterium]|jgi:uncharacterized membrane protein YhhN|nr:lysoplasmalogenase [Symbiobacteriaceae bacterium]
MLSVAIGVSGLVYLWAATKGWRKVVYLLKPGTMLLIIALAVSGALSGATGSYAIWVVAALVASVLGDVFLMLPKDRFIYGLSAFLVAHLFYIYALWGALPVQWDVRDLLYAPLLVLAVWALLREISTGLRERGQKRLLPPVMVYATAIGTMAWRAFCLIKVDGMPVPIWVVVAGAGLFVLSDALLAYNRFVKPIPYRDILVMGTYFAAQYLFAYSTLG